MIFDLGDGPLLVFGGPYSNFRALAALRARATALGVSASRTICTGDVVAYCAEPEETIAAMRDWGCHVVAGNCEQQLALGADDCGCGFVQGSACDALSKGWYGFASTRVSAASRAWMARLPNSLWFTYGGFSLRVVHGGVDQTNRFVFASQERLIAAELARGRADIVIAGHAGLPFIKRHGDQVWFNPGVIGMPANDGTPDVWYAVVRGTGDGLSFLTQRLAYDHEGAASALRTQGYADAYADALSTGHFGVMFFAEPELSFANMRTALRRGGRMVFACWREPRKNPWMILPLQEAYKHVPCLPEVGPEDPGPFAFASEKRVHRILSAAGFTSVAIESVELSFDLAVGWGLDGAVTAALSIGPVSRALEGQPPELGSPGSRS